MNRQMLKEYHHRGDIIFTAIACVLRNRTHKNKALRYILYSEIFSNYLFRDVKNKSKENGAVLQKMHYEVAQRF